MTLRIIPLAVMALALTACQPAPKATAPATSNNGPAGAASFLKSVFDRCLQSKTYVTLDSHAADVYDPDTTALMGDDARLTPPGQWGVMNEDPVCNLREYENPNPALTVKSATASSAEIEVNLRSGGDHEGPVLTYFLARTGSNWRIHDIDRPEPSLRAIFTDGRAVTTPLQFMQTLYGHYTTGFGKDDWNFSPLVEVAPAYFDPDMVALMKEDDRLNEGEVGALDADPICGCQDTYPMKVTFTVENASATDATIVAHVSDTKAHSEIDRRYLLKSSGGRWRIHDIVASDYGSLRALFIKSNREAAAYNATHPASESATASSL